MSGRFFHIGQRVRIVDGPEYQVGFLATVTGHPHALGLITAPESTLCGMPAETIIQAIEIDVLVGHEAADRWLKKFGGYLASPVDWLEPVWDGKEPAEWTEELRSICGLKKKEPVSA